MPVRVGEAGDPFRRGREQHPVPVAGGDDPERGRHVCFPRAGRAEQDDVAGLGEEPSRCQGCDLLTDRGLRVPVEVLDGLAPGEPGGADAQFRAGCVAGAHFAFEDGGEVVLERPARIPGLVREAGGGFGDPRCFQGASEVGDLLVRFRCLRGGHQLISPSMIPKARS